MGASGGASGPDFSRGVKPADVPMGGILAGRVGTEPVLLSRFGDELFAVSGACTHYGAALADGLVAGDTIRCPLHRACFSLRTGAALAAPAFDGLERWEVEVREDLAFVRRKREPATVPKAAAPDGVRRVVVVGGGAAAFACAERLRALGYDGRLTMLSADADPPCDRPNLSKDFLAGNAPPEWIPLRNERWYRELAIDLRLDTEVVAIDTADRRVTTRSGATFSFDRLLIATGCDPTRIAEGSFSSGVVRYLRSVADAAALVELAKPGARVAILGSSFIGLEAAAALRIRGLDVAIVSPDQVPFEYALGRQVGRFFQTLHERNGVELHLGRIGVGYDGQRLRLDDGHHVEADFVLAGIGVRPRTALAEAAGLEVARGVRVNACLESSLPGIYAAGDVASYPDPLSGKPFRIEHWVVAQRQGQTVALNMLGLRTPFRSVPFFWTEQYGTALRYVGHAERPSDVRIEGSIEAGTFIARFYEDGMLRASAAVGMDQASLEDELQLEQLIAASAEAEEEKQPQREPDALVPHPI